MQIIHEHRIKVMNKQTNPFQTLVLLLVFKTQQAILKLLTAEVKISRKDGGWKA